MKTIMFFSYVGSLPLISNPFLDVHGSAHSSSSFLKVEKNLRICSKNANTKAKISNLSPLRSPIFCILLVMGHLKKKHFYVEDSSAATLFSDLHIEKMRKTLVL